VKEQLISMGVDSQKVRLIYPWVDTNRFECSQPPNMEEFRILSASAPDAIWKDKDLFVEKGMDLLLESFSEFSRGRKARLFLLWRGLYNERLSKKIEELNLEDCVEVINGVADTPALYVRAHITVIPFLSLLGSPEIPLSAAESLVCGRPVVTTDIPEIAEIVRTYTCGCVTRPVKEDFLSALIECSRNYMRYQANCKKVADELFKLNIEVFKRYPWGKAT
jgi:glycosyltransferase involved in cell wall biosynthesis